MQYFSISPLKGRAFAIALALVLLVFFILIAQRLYLPIWQLGFYNLGVVTHLLILFCLPIFYQRLRYLQAQSIAWPFSLSIEGGLLIQAEQYQIDDRSLYLGRWILLVCRHAVTQNVKRCFFAPDNLSDVDRRRLKRVIKRGDVKK